MILQENDPSSKLFNFTRKQLTWLVHNLLRAAGKTLVDSHETPSCQDANRFLQHNLHTINDKLHMGNEMVLFVC